MRGEDVRAAVDDMRAYCQTLLDVIGARTILVFDDDWLLVEVGEPERLVSWLGCRSSLYRAPHALVQGIDQSHWAPIPGCRLVLVVAFDARTTRERVEKECKRAVHEIRHMVWRRRPAWFPPPTGSSGPSGANAHAWLSVSAIRKHRLG